MPASAERVKDETTTTGTGSLTLSGTAPTGFVAFDDAFGNGGIEAKRFFYCCESADHADWEVGIGYLSGATTLERETLIASSTGSAVSFASGTKTVFETGPGWQEQRRINRGAALLVCRGNFLP